METKNFTSDAQRTILYELGRIQNGRKKVMHNAVMIVCPFHQDSAPSLIVTTSSSKGYPVGGFFCFGCGKKGRWNVLAEKLGLQKITKDQTTLTEFHGRDISPELLESNDDPFTSLCNDFNVDFPIEWQHDTWRKIKAPVMRQIKAYMALDGKTEKKVAILPVWVNGELVGGIKALYERKGKELAYINKSGTWAKENGLFPYDAIKKLTSKYKAVVLTEGSRDALRLIQCGIPALAILGTKNWSEEKKMLVLALGVQKIVLMMDSDKPGRIAQKLIRESLKNTVHIVSINMKRLEQSTNNLRKLKKQNPVSKVDCCSMPIRFVKILKDKYFHE